MSKQKKISYKKARKKDRQQKNIERLHRQMKKDTSSMISDLSSYSNMIDEFKTNVHRLKMICHTAVVAQFEKYKDQTLDPSHEKYIRLAELQGLNIALDSTEEDIEKLRNIFAMMKKVRIDPMKSIDIVTNQLIPAISTFQIKMIDIFDMFKQIIPKNREVLEELAKSDPNVNTVLQVIDTMDTVTIPSLSEKEEKPEEPVLVDDNEEQEGGIRLTL